MKNFSGLFFILLLSFFAGCGGKSTGGKQSGGMTTYSDQEMGFSIEHPSDWSKETKSNRVGFFSPDDQAAIFVTMYYNIPEDENIEDIFENVIVRPYQKPESFGIGENLMDEEDRSWTPEIAAAAGADSGYGGFFDGKISGTDIVMLVSVLKKGATAYQVMTYAAKSSGDKYKKIMQNAFATFKIGE
ncbi:MAG: hypothetical protein HPY53_10680 [Brevinematales bacterium]|nr:hypothetical protein [Brevinematales bacterium]